MVTIANKLRQPLILNLKDKTTLHLHAKGTEESKAELTSEQFDSPEVKNAIDNGDIVVLKMD